MKKLIAMAIVLCMVLGMVPMIASAADAKTIYFDNSVKNWSKVNVYYWGGTSTVTWPGVAMTNNGDNVWSYEVPNDATKIIFNNGSDQTADLTIPTDGKNMFNGSGWGTYGSDDFEELEDIVIYFDNSSKNWSEPYAYTWVGAPLVSWPGAPMTKVEGNIWTYTVPAGYSNLIINDNGGEQTDNLTIPTDGKNCWNGAAWVKYPYSGDTPTPPPAAPELSEEKITVFVKSTLAVPYLYGWVDGTALFDTAWPGKAMTATDDLGWFSAEISKSITHVVINNGSDEQKTGDLTLDPAKPYLLMIDTTTVLAFATQAEADAYVPGDEPVNPPAPPAGNADDYYLFGWINGADYGDMDDYATLGIYKFEENKLTVTFESDSYVGVKTGDNSKWYMTNGYQGEVTSVTLHNTNNSDQFTDTPDKLLIPGGKEVILTIAKGDNDTLTLSYTVAAGDPVPPTTTEAPETTKAPEVKPTEAPAATESKPEESNPTESKPEESNPAESKPEESKPAESKPEESNPTESKPEESNPAESKPEESKPAESKPEESNPAESKPEESKPAESKPEESNPAESKPEETKPAESKPEETKPEETNPAESKPEETKPEETKPAESKPEETTKPEITEITVYAKVPEGWENPGVWAWNDKQENAFEAWPGLAMTQGENGWWYAKVPAWVENVIINANGGSYQTADLDLEQLKADVWVEVTVDANGTAHAELKYTSPATGDETALVSAAAVMLFAAMGVVALVKGKKYF